ncbi:MAG TPA: DUF3800 domain-containing protein [Caulobacteraceae bacterium]
MAEFSDYIVFADESGDHGLEAYSADYPVFVLAFTLVHKEAYSLRPAQPNRAFDILAPKLKALKTFP